MKRNKSLLEGQRFDDESNIVYKVPVNRLDKRNMHDSKKGTVEVIDFEADSTLDMIIEFIRHHQDKQVPRLQELKNYYDTKNNVKYRKPKPGNRADNRIASDFAKFITEFKAGVIVGNPIEYTGDENITERIKEFSKQNNESKHNQDMVSDAIIYGKAYELIYRDDYFNEAVKKLDPRQTFVIYDTTKEENSVCGVRYFPITFNNKTDTHIEIYANDGFVYEYIAEDERLDNAVLDNKYQSYFDAVQVNQWKLNNEQFSDYENILDNIDAYDLNQSEMANFMQDNSEAVMVIKGNPDTFKKDDGSMDTEGFDYSVKNRYLILGDSKIYQDGDKVTKGAEPDAFYLVKEYDVDGVEANNERLVADMLRFTHLIDFTDENMGGNQSGIGFRFKSWGNENDRVNKERMITKAIMRRLRLVAHSWAIKDTLQPKTLAEKVKSFVSYENNDKAEELYHEVNDVEVKFNPNVPQSDVEIMNVIKGMYGVVSDQTIFELSKQLTGVDAKEEKERIETESRNDTPDPRFPVEQLSKESDSTDSQEEIEETDEDSDGE